MKFTTKELESIKIKDTWADRRYRSTPEIRKQAKEMLSEGFTKTEIAKCFGVANRTIYQWLLTPEQRNIMLEKRKISNKKYYQSKEEVRKKITESTRKSREYKANLLNLRLKMGIN